MFYSKLWISIELILIMGIELIFELIFESIFEFLVVFVLFLWLKCLMLLRKFNWFSNGNNFFLNVNMLSRDWICVKESFNFVSTFILNTIKVTNILINNFLRWKDDFSNSILHV